MLTLKQIVSFIVSLALFMDALDSSIINTAIPAMSHSLHVYPVDLKVALLSYLLSLTIFIPISGWVADHYGVKKSFISALFVFTVGSFWCGNVHALLELVMARALQGMGGALMLPLGRLILLRTFPRHELVNAMNHVIIIVALGVMLGPLAGGIITDHLSWPWIFWVNIPIGFFALAIAMVWLPKDEPKKGQPFDFWGFVFFSSGLATLTFALSNLSESYASLTYNLSILSIAVLLLIIYFLYSYKRPHTILNISLFRLRTFRISIIANLCCRLGFGGVPFLLPLLLQIGLGYSAQLSGLLMVPIAIGIMLMKSVSLPIFRWFGFKRVLLFNTMLVAAALLAFRMINVGTSVYTIASLAFLFGFLIALQYGAMNSLAYADISEHEHSSAASIISTNQQLAQSFGVSITALLLHYYTSIAPHAYHLTIPIFHETFFALGLLTLISTLIFLKLKPEDGRQLLKRKEEIEQG